MTADGMAKNMARSVKKDNRSLDREKRAMERDQEKLKAEIKAAAKRGDKKTVQILAKSLVNLQKQSERMVKQKSTNTSIQYQTKAVANNVKLVGHMQKQTSMMGQMNKMMPTKQLQNTTREFAKQSMKMQMTQELMDDLIEDLDYSDIEEEADKEVDAVLFEITQGQLGSVAVPSQSIKTKESVSEEQERDMQTRMESLAFG